MLLKVFHLLIHALLLQFGNLLLLRIPHLLDLLFFSLDLLVHLLLKFFYLPHLFPLFFSDNLFFLMPSFLGFLLTLLSNFSFTCLFQFFLFALKVVQLLLLDSLNIFHVLLLKSQFFAFEFGQLLSMRF